MANGGIFDTLNFSDPARILIKTKNQPGISHMTQERETVINNRLLNMKRFLTEIESLGWDKKEQAREGYYLRVNGEGVRPVSLHDKSALCGLEKGTSKRPHNAIQDIKSAAKSFGTISEKVFESKKERRLQAFIIRQALINDGNLLENPLFNCLKDHFKTLKFAFDEISFGDNRHENGDHPKIVRCDILAAGVMINGDSLPVLIELKSTRNLERLNVQLDNAKNEITQGNERINLIKDLIKISTGLDVNTSQNPHKIIVWPQAKESKETTRRLAADYRDVTIIEYEQHGLFDPTGVTYNLRNVAHENVD